jgi:hypothetical protein
MAVRAGSVLVGRPDMTRTDRDHLQALSICHYVFGGLCVCFGALPIVYLAVGIAILAEGFPPPQQGNDAPPFPAELFGWVMVVFAAVGIVFTWGLAAALVVAGRCIARRKWRPFCLVVAGFSCLFQPLGLVLGIFTFIVLLRPGVSAAFEPNRTGPPEFDTYHSD